MGLWRGLRICVSNKFPADAHAAGSRITLCKARVYGTSMGCTVAKRSDPKRMTFASPAGAGVCWQCHLCSSPALPHNGNGSAGQILLLRSRFDASISKALSVLRLHDYLIHSNAYTVVEIYVFVFIFVLKKAAGKAWESCERDSQQRPLELDPCP